MGGWISMIAIDSFDWTSREPIPRVYPGQGRARYVRRSFGMVHGAFGTKVGSGRRRVQDTSRAEPGPDDTYVLTLDEISDLAHEGGKPAETLMNVVALIARRCQTDVCSAYLLEPDRANLVLAATVGLRPQCIGSLRMAIQEGLAGLVAEQVRPVAVDQVKNHPRLSI